MDLLLGIAAMVLVGCSWSVDGYVMGKAPRQGIHIPVLLFLTYLVSTGISGIAGVVRGVPAVSVNVFLLVFLALFLQGIFNSFQLEVMSRAMQRGPNGIIWTMTQSGFIFPFAMGILFFQVPLGILRGIGFLLILASLYLFGRSSGGSDGGTAGKWRLLAVSAFILTGISQCLSNLPSYSAEASRVTSEWRTFAASLGFMAGALLMRWRDFGVFLKDVRLGFGSSLIWKYCGLLNLFAIVSSILLLYPGMDRLSRCGYGAIAYPLMVCSCLIFFELFAILILHEKRSATQKIALGLCLLGTIALCR